MSLAWDDIPLSVLRFLDIDPRPTDLEVLLGAVRCGCLFIDGEANGVHRKHSQRPDGLVSKAGL